MANININSIIKIKNGNSSQLASSAYVPQLGEPIYDSTVNNIKIGDGNKPIVELAYIGSSEYASKSDLSAYIPKSGGTVTGNLVFNNHKITGLGTPSLNTDATTKEYVDNLVDSAISDGNYLPLSGGTMTGNLNMNGNTIVNIKEPVNDGDAVNKEYVDNEITIALVGNYLPLGGGTLTGSLAMSNNKITGLRNPTDSTDAATKAYVDSGLADKLDASAQATSASEADSLTTARTFIANLASTTAGSFDGTKNVTLGTTGTLPLTKGGTGATTAAGVLTNLGISATATELNYMDGVTSNVQTQLGKKAPIASPMFTGTPKAPTASAGTNTTQIATTAFVKTEINNVLESAGALIYKGTIGADGTVTALPENHTVGDTYVVATAGSYAGETCETGDMIICVTTGDTDNNADWNVVQTNINGAVAGPTSSVANHVATFNGSTGKIIKDSGFTIASSVPANAKFTDTTYTLGSFGITATAAEINKLDGVTATAKELNYVDGVTSNIQTQLNNKASNSVFKAATTSVAGGTGLVPAPTAGAANRYLRSDGTWAVPPDTNTTYTLSSFGITATAAELNYMDGVTSNVQTQLNAKQPTITGGASSITTSNLTASRALVSDASGKVVVSAVTSTELGYLDGVTSAVQTQLNAKAPLASPTFTGTPKAPTAAAGTNTTQVATTAYVKTEINNVLAANNAMEYKGTVGTSGTVTVLPTSHAVGDTYVVATAGSYAGETCEVGDMIICITAGTVANNDHWTVVQTNINGAVTGPASAVTNRVATFNGTTGKVIKDSGFTIASSVPANAKFTDTTYSVMGAASASAAGTSGLVPAPAAGKQTSFLRGDGTWAVPTNTTYSNMTGATTSTAGKAGLVPAPAAGAATRYLRSDGTWAVPPDTNTTYTLSSFGITATAAEINKLDGLATTKTELSYVDGVTSNIQTQLNGKQATITGGATTITTSNLAASRALISSTAGKVAVSAVTSTELGYLDGVTSAIQTQLNGKQATITGGATTIASSNLTVNRALVSNASGKVAVSSVTSTELGYLDGVTSAIQTQLNNRISTSDTLYLDAGTIS